MASDRLGVRTVFDLHPRRLVRNSMAREMRRRVAARETAHSFTRITVHPARRKCWDTRRSRRWLFSILSRQNLVFVLGKYLQRHPCQKQPSTNTATLSLGHAKSGLPSTVHCLRYPRRPADQSRCPNACSVDRFPAERTAAMILDRTSLGTRSMLIVQSGIQNSALRISSARRPRSSAAHAARSLPSLCTESRRRTPSGNTSTSFGA